MKYVLSPQEPYSDILIAYSLVATNFISGSLTADPFEIYRIQRNSDQWTLDNTTKFQEEHRECRIIACCSTL